MNTLEKKIAILKQVRRNLKKGVGYGYICLNILYTSTKGRDYRTEAYELRTFVERAVGGHTYEIWLRRNHYWIWDKMTTAQIQEGRVQWIDWMIAQLQSGRDLK